MYLAISIVRRCHAISQSVQFRSRIRYTVNTSYTINVTDMGPIDLYSVWDHAAARFLATSVSDQEY